MSIPDKYVKQRIGASGYRIVDVDLDGVCADYSAGLLEFMAQRGEVEMSTVPEPDQYNLAKASGWPFRSIEHYLAVHRQAVKNGLYAKLPIYESAAEELAVLSRNDVHIRIVTHRLFLSGLHRQVINDTNNWLDTHNLPFMSLCFLGVKDSLTSSLHIDDSPSIIADLVSMDKKVLIYDQPYNRSLDGDRMFGWKNGASKILDILDAK